MTWRSAKRCGCRRAVRACVRVCVGVGGWPACHAVIPPCTGTTAALDVFRAHAPRAARVHPCALPSDRRLLHVGHDHDSRAIAAAPHFFESGLAPLPLPASFTSSANRHARRVLAKATGPGGGGASEALGAGGAGAVARLLNAQGAPGVDEANFEAWCRMKFGVVA